MRGSSDLLALVHDGKGGSHVGRCSRYAGERIGDSDSEADLIVEISLGCSVMDTKCAAHRTTNDWARVWFAEIHDIGGG